MKVFQILALMIIIPVAIVLVVANEKFNHDHDPGYGLANDMEFDDFAHKVGKPVYWLAGKLPGFLR